MKTSYNRPHGLYTRLLILLNRGNTFLRNTSVPHIHTYIHTFSHIHSLSECSQLMGEYDAVEKGCSFSSVQSISRRICFWKPKISRTRFSESITVKNLTGMLFKILTCNSYNSLCSSGHWQLPGFQFYQL